MADGLSGPAGKWPGKEGEIFLLQACVKRLCPSVHGMTMAQGPSHACVVPRTKPSASMSCVHVLQHPSGSYLKLSYASMPAPCSRIALWRAIPTSGMHESLLG